MQKTCSWLRDEDSQETFYETTCKNAFEFTEGTPKDNKFRFCPYCGKRLKVVKSCVLDWNLAGNRL